MNVVEEAARIAAARFAALATSVYSGDPLTSDLTWLNNRLTPGQNFLVGYGFGTYDPATGMFNMAAFEVDGVTYVFGSVLQSPAPAQGSSKSDNLPSYALYVAEAMTLDAYCFIATGILGLASADYGVGSRVIGFNWTDFQNLTFAAVNVFEDVLTISPAVAAAEISNFAVRKA